MNRIWTTTATLGVAVLLGIGCERDHEPHATTQPTTGDQVESAAERTGDAIERGAEATGEVLNRAAREAGELIGQGVDRIEREVPDAMERGDRAVDAAVREATRDDPETTQPTVVERRTTIITTQPVPEQP